MSKSEFPSPASAADSVYYHNDETGSRILVRMLKSKLGNTVLEVGAGAGFVTQELARQGQSVVALEPNVVLFDELRERTAHLSNVTALKLTLSEFARYQSAEPDIPRFFDSVVYINVLEHIEHDGKELTLAKDVLSRNGRVLIVVPAHRWLYSKVDRLTGHFRRYSKSALSSLLGQAGLHPTSIHYFDSVGLLPYLVIYKCLRSTAVSGTNAVIHSRLILPISSLLYQVSRGRLIGKNLIAVAESTK